MLDSTRYKSFVSERDKTLEKINQNAQLDLSRILFDWLSQIEMAASYLLLKRINDKVNFSSLAQQFEQQTLYFFSLAIPTLVDRIKKMRIATYTLTYLSELEAIGQATKKVSSPEESSIHALDQKIKNTVSSKTLMGEELDERVWLNLMKLRGKILSAFRLGLVQKKNPEEILKKIQDQFPKVVSYKRPPRALKPLREASQSLGDKKEISQDFIDEELWGLVRKSYLETELPPSRFDSSLVTEEGYHAHDWEVTQEMTDDFVNQVRSAQMDAGTNLGIQDFVWVAIIDEKTDDCCLHRNGMTTEEIENKVKEEGGEFYKCDATSPPAHPNCRCQLAPVGATDQVEGPDWKSFGEWLES